MSAEAKRVLVVEDNVALASVVRFNLEKSGYHVTVAHDGREAWRRLYDGDFDLAVIDHQMPEMTGEELCRLIRGYERSARLPVVMLTAKKYEINHDVLTNELGVYDIIPKPFSPRALTRTVEDCLSGAVPR
jgi:two-component system alkaline phosphatase synthesis response regulator PhoP